MYYLSGSNLFFQSLDTLVRGNKEEGASRGLYPLIIELACLKRVFDGRGSNYAPLFKAPLINENLIRG
jgi:hypothetical protein